MLWYFDKYCNNIIIINTIVCQGKTGNRKDKKGKRETRQSKIGNRTTILIITTMNRKIMMK
jgi:hypothetical protein